MYKRQRLSGIKPFGISSPEKKCIYWIFFYLLVCGGHLYINSGIIRTPNSPHAYPTNLDCEWQLKGELGYFYHIYLIGVNFLKSEICSDADYLTIYDGNQIGDPIIAQICERLPYYTYYSSSRNEAKIRLITDSVGADNSTLSPAFSIWYFQGIHRKVTA